MSSKLSFFDGNINLCDILLDKEIEIWKLYFELDIDQKERTSFKTKIKAGNSHRKETNPVIGIFEFDDKSKTRKVIFGNPFEKNMNLVDHIVFEYYDYNDSALVYIRIYTYEIDESSREDLFPFSTTE